MFLFSKLAVVSCLSISKDKALHLMNVHVKDCSRPRATLAGVIHRRKGFFKTFAPFKCLTGAHHHTVLEVNVNQFDLKSWFDLNPHPIKNVAKKKEKFSNTTVNNFIMGKVQSQQCRTCFESPPVIKH